MSVYSPWQLDRATVGGRLVDLESGAELGHNVYSTAVDIPPGSSVRLELGLTGTMPGDHDTYRLDLHRHPRSLPTTAHHAHGPLGMAERRPVTAVERAAAFRE